MAFLLILALSCHQSTSLRQRRKIMTNVHRRMRCKCNNLEVWKEYKKGKQKNVQTMVYFVVVRMANHQTTRYHKNQIECSSCHTSCKTASIWTGSTKEGPSKCSRSSVVQRSFMTCCTTQDKYSCFNLQLEIDSYPTDDLLCLDADCWPSQLRNYLYTVSHRLNEIIEDK